MLPRNVWLAMQVCLFACLASCAPIGFGEQELTLRHDAKADAIEVLIVYDAIQANQDDATVSRNFAARVSGGHREFMVFDWPLHFDLGDIEAKMREQAELETDPWRDWSRELALNLRHVKVADSGYFDGQAGRLGLQQCLRIGDAAHWISLFERALYIGIEESLAKGTLESDFGLLDARTRDLWIAMAQEKQSWLSLRDGVLSVDLPATGACAGRVLGGIMRGSAQNTGSARFFAGLVSHISELKIADEHVLLRWKLAGPTFTFAAAEDQPYDGRLAVSLRESKSLPENLPSRSEVIENFCKR